MIITATQIITEHGTERYDFFLHRFYKWRYQQSACSAYLPQPAWSLLAEPTKPEPATMPAPETIAEPIIAPEPEPDGKSDQVHELATLSIPVGVLVEF